MTISYDNTTKTWTIQLEPNEESVWARYRARLKDQEHQPVTNNGAMKTLVSDAWKAAKQWTRTATNQARERAFDQATPTQQEAARDAAEAAIAAAIGFDPEA